jgi:hypothetical protein
VYWFWRKAEEEGCRNRDSQASVGANGEGSAPNAPAAASDLTPQMINTLFGPWWAGGVIVLSVCRGCIGFGGRLKKRGVGIECRVAGQESQQYCVIYSKSILDLQPYTLFLHPSSSAFLQNQYTPYMIFYQYFSTVGKKSR